jgi:hypothetical protein
MMMILYADKVSPTEIENMDFSQLKYWSECSKAINKSRRDAEKAAMN